MNLGHKKDKSICLIYVFLWMIGGLTLSSCDKYVPPSPMDGIWIAESWETRHNESASLQAQTLENSLWRFSNTLFRYELKGKGIIDAYLMIKGNEMRLIRRASTSQHPWPIPPFEKDRELMFKYKIYKGHLELRTRDYYIRLKKI